MSKENATSQTDDQTAVNYDTFISVSPGGSNRDGDSCVSLTFQNFDTGQTGTLSLAWFEFANVADKIQDVAKTVAVLSGQGHVGDVPQGHSNNNPSGSD